MPAAASSSSLPLPATPMSKPDAAPVHPFSPVALRHHLSRLGADFSAAIEGSRRFLLGGVSNVIGHRHGSGLPLPLFACASQQHQKLEMKGSEGKHAFDLALGVDYIAKTLAGTSVYTVSNSNNEFVLISDPNNSLKSLGLLCFRQEDAQALLAQVQLKQPVLGRGARVVPISLDQVYMLKVEGIAFRFLPDPLQLKNALELKSSDGFDGVPVFQSDLLVVKKRNRRYSPIYFQKEDIERELMKVSRSSKRPGTSQNIMVGSLEDVLKKMEINDKDSGWEDLVFIPPGKSYSQHIGEVAV